MGTQTFESRRQGLADEVHEAEDAILGAMRRRAGAGERWTVRQLQDALGGDWSPAVISIALSRLVSKERLLLDDEFEAHLPPN